MNTSYENKVAKHFKLKQHIAQLETKYGQQISLLKKLVHSLEVDLEKDIQQSKEATLNELTREYESRVNKIFGLEEDL